MTRYTSPPDSNRKHALLSAAILLGIVAPVQAQVGGADTAEPRTITFPAAVVEEFTSRGEAFLPGTGMSVKLADGITAVEGVATSTDEQLLIVDGVVAGLSTDENAAEITRSSDIELARPLAIDHPGAARFGRPILLISTRNAPGRTTVAVPDAAGSGGNLVLRGLGAGGGADAPLMMIDGMMLAPGAERPGLTPDMIERIEIIKGPAALKLYGARAANGIIRITTKK